MPGIVVVLECEALGFERSHLAFYIVADRPCQGRSGKKVIAWMTGHPHTVRMENSPSKFARVRNQRLKTENACDLPNTSGSTAGVNLLRLSGSQRVERVLAGPAPGSGGKGSRFLSAKLRLLADLCRLSGEWGDPLRVLLSEIRFLVPDSN